MIKQVTLGRVFQGVFNLTPIGSDAAEALSTLNSLVATTHAAAIGDIIVMTSGVNVGQVSPVKSVSANQINLLGTLTAAPSVGDTFLIYRNGIEKSTGALSIASGTTDSAAAAAVAGKALRVTGGEISCAGTATAVTINSKPGGAGAAISITFNLAANSSIILPVNKAGYCQSVVGQGLSITTGVGSTVGARLSFEEI